MDVKDPSLSSLSKFAVLVSGCNSFGSGVKMGFSEVVLLTVC